MNHVKLLLAALALLLVQSAGAGDATPDPLPSWNDGPSKRAILDYVRRVTAADGPERLAPADRLAVFDNDGTLWTEHPMYVELAFAVDRVRTLAPQHPEWRSQQPFQAALDGDHAALARAGGKGIVAMLAAAHEGMTTAEFAKVAGHWLQTARHPRFKRPYTDLVYQPMLELLAYLRASGFQTFIVSGGGIEFMRLFTQRVYGVPPEQVVGSSIHLSFELRPDGPVLVWRRAFDFVDDGPGKPVGIFRFIGRHPVFAFGNSDGDKQMLEWTAAGKGRRFMGLVHHTDALREYAYDRDTGYGRLDKALDEARQRGWIVVDMKSEWRVIYPFEK
jgi:hypothetical protein